MEEVNNWFFFDSNIHLLSPDKALAIAIQSEQSEDEEQQQEIEAEEQQQQLVEELKKLKKQSQPRKKKKKALRVVESSDEEVDAEQEEVAAMTSEEWNDVEINQLTDALESMRKKGHTLGLYGLNDQQATWIFKQHVPTKTIRQIKR